VLALCFTVLTLEGYDVVVYGTVVPSLLAYEPWSLTSEAAGTLGSLAVSGMLVGALLAGAVTDRVGRRRVLIGSVVLFSLAMGACAIAPSPEVFGALRFLVGLGTGGLMPTAVALLIEYSPPARRNLNAAIAFAGVGLGGALAGLLALLLLPAHGFRVMFALGAVPVVVVLPLLLRHMPESVGFLLARGRTADAADTVRRHRLQVTPAAAGTGPAPRPRAALARLFSRTYLPSTLLFWLATFCCLLVLFGANAWLPTLMVKAGYGLTSSLSFLLVLNLGAVAGALGSSLVADRIGSKPVTVAAFGAAAASLMLLSYHPPTAVVYVLVAIAGFGTTGTQILLNAYVGGYYPTASRAAALGLSLGVGRLGGILGPAYGGVVLSSGIGLPWHFLAFALPALLGALVTACVPRTPHEAGDPVAASQAVATDAVT
jgi:AAHS family benzoate transporter-like MFS transporter